MVVLRWYTGARIIQNCLPYTDRLRNLKFAELQISVLTDALFNVCIASHLVDSLKNFTKL